MIAILGPPPSYVLEQSGEKAYQYWDKTGKRDHVTQPGATATNNSEQVIGILVPIPNTSLEIAEERLRGEEKQKFLAFMRRMLKWDPKEREDSNDIYWDEWLLADLIESGQVGWEA